MPYNLGYLSEFNPELKNSESLKPILLSALEKHVEVLPIFCHSTTLTTIKSSLINNATIVVRILGSSSNAGLIELKQSLEDNGFNLINKQSKSQNAKDKMATYHILSEAGLPCIPTQSITSGEPITLNHIVKPRFGMKGESILFGKINIENIPDAVSEFVPSNMGGDWITQPYIPDSKNWWRVLVVNGEVVASYKRIPSDYTFVSNVSKGAIRNFSDFPSREVTDLAVEASRIMGLDICGVDITSHPYMVVEVNSVPAVPREFAEKTSRQILRLTKIKNDY